MTPSCTCAAEDLGDSFCSRHAWGLQPPCRSWCMSECPGVLSLGVGLSPEARLKPPALSAVFAACQTDPGLWPSLVGEVGDIWGVYFTATGCLLSPEIMTCLTLSKSARLLHISVKSWNAKQVQTGRGGAGREKERLVFTVQYFRLDCVELKCFRMLPIQKTL